ncbi:acyltransferase [Pedobacter heparinus]|uniref:acyltransferase family protein n=1 Tax=Pedobacter heparinus TaxID=984 RepID=UPI002931E7A4|nr:acyltransferase [Pedobacter heparinus]
MKVEVKYYWLDLIRGLAALAVFLGHLRIITFKDTPTYELDILGKLVFFATGFGHISVTLFFTLSGFLIIGSIHESVAAKRWAFSNYANNRLIRLWVVLIPCLVLGLIWDKIGLTFFGDSIFYSNQWKYFLNQDLPSKLTPEIFIGNVLFLQKILVPTLGSNGSLWSLTNEFWYYVTFPLLFFSSFRYYGKATRMIFAIASVMILFFVGKDIAINFILWLMGGISYIMLKKIKISIFDNKPALFILTLLFLITISLTRSKLYPAIFNNFSIGLVFSLLIPFLTRAQMRNQLLKKVSIYLSDVSYTLYLAHLPIIYVITSMISAQSLDWSNKNFLIYLAISTTVFMYSRLLWFLFEKNTKNIKYWIQAQQTKLNVLKLKNQEEKSSNSKY